MFELVWKDCGGYRILPARRTAAVPARRRSGVHAPCLGFSLELSTPLPISLLSCWASGGSDTSGCFGRCGGREGILEPRFFEETIAVVNDTQDNSQSPVGAGSLPKVLVVDDDEQILRQLGWALSDEFLVYSTGDRETALETFRREQTPVVLLDLGLPPHPRDASEGLLALEGLLAENPLVKVIVVSGNSDRQNALSAVEKGAHDIFPKPVDIDELKVVLRRAFKRLDLERESQEERSLANQMSFEDIIGSSPLMKVVFSTVRKISGTDVSVLVTGESGTGKELVAQAIHNLSPRGGKPFVAINCGAIPESLLESELFGHEKGAFTGATAQRLGKLECAPGGTLFLDEIGELAQTLQVKLLRFLQEKVIERVGGRELIPVDSRVIAATNQDPEKAVEEGRFREDLYFRLAVVKLVLPPLRERGDDVIQLAEHLLALYSKELKRPLKKLSKQAVTALRKHPWPGNVRELQNRVKRAVLLVDGPSVGALELDLESASHSSPASSTSLKEARKDLEKNMVARALEEHQGNISKTARALGVSRPTLYGIIARYGL